VTAWLLDTGDWLVTHTFVYYLAAENTHKHTRECTKLNGTKGLG